MKFCDKCPNKKICQVGIMIGGVSLLASSFILLKKLYKKFSKSKDNSSDKEPDNIQV